LWKYERGRKEGEVGRKEVGKKVERTKCRKADRKEGMKVRRKECRKEVETRKKIEGKK